MSDRELLELAAKAVGISGEYVTNYSGDYYYQGNTEGILYEHPLGGWGVWNPLTDDGDALRLAVKLHMSVMVFPDPDQRSEACSHKAANFCDEAARHNGGDIYVATRRAIVRAAAEIGKAMP